MTNTQEVNVAKLNYFLDYFSKNQKGFNKLLHMVHVDDIVPNVQNLMRSINQVQGHFQHQVKQSVNEICKIRKDTQSENEAVIAQIAQKVGDKITKKVVNRTDKIVRGKMRFYNRKARIASRHYTINSQKEADHITKDGLHRCFDYTYLKVQGGGRHKSYFVVINQHDTRKYISLGSAKKITLERARAKSITTIRSIFDDDEFFKNRLLKKKQEKEMFKKEIEEMEADNIGQLIRNYIPLRARRYSNLKEAKQFHNHMMKFAKYVKKTSPKASINDIDARYVAKYLENKFKTTFPLACKILTYLQGFFKHLQSIEIYKHTVNPCVRNHIINNILMIEKPKIDHMPSLSWRELPRFVNIVKSHLTNNPNHKAAKIGIELLILTGLRFSELFGSENYIENKNGINWKWVNFEQKIIKIPKGYMKNKKYGHTIPITPKIKELLLATRQFFPNSKTLFEFRSRDKDEARTLLKMILTKQPIYARDEYGDFIKDKKGNNKLITLHGFRTTLSTFIVENFNVNTVELDSFLHHVSGTITNTYLSGNFHEVRYNIIHAYEQFIYENKMPKPRERLKANIE